MVLVKRFIGGFRRRKMKTLIIGTTCVDMIMRVPYLPKTQQDVNTISCDLAIGGMAYNVYNSLEVCDCQAILASPIGEGHWADVMRGLLAEKKVEPFAVIKGKDNGVCLCFVENNGERTFLSHHGAEYQFDRKWFDQLDFSEIDRIYVGGLEVEEETGEQLVDFVLEKGKEIFFAPGPRFENIPKKRLEKLLSCKPILHLNEIEALQLSQEPNVALAANRLYQMTNQMVVVTCGKQGAYLKDDCYDELIPCQKVAVVDTIGAGDCHAGALLACLQVQMDHKKAIQLANMASGFVVGHHGAGFSEQQAAQLQMIFMELKG